MSFDSPHEQKQAKVAAPKAASRDEGAETAGIGTHFIRGLGSLGWLDEVYHGAVNSLSGWGMNPNHVTPSGPATPNGPSTPQAVQASVLARTTQHTAGDTANLAPALQSAAQGDTVADQARKLPGPVTMTAADALVIAGQMDPDPSGPARQQMQDANNEPGGYKSPFVSVALSGIRNNQQEAEKISTEITGDQTPHGYAAYGSNDKSYQEEGGGSGIDSPDKKSPKGPGADYIDAGNDIAAVTQYAAAAELGIKLTPNDAGDGKTVSIDWAALGKMEISANLGPLGGKIAYDNPARVAENGYETVMAEIAQRKGDPADKGQFISLTGHSGGGQSSFYTALKLASEGYKNISLVGVDMAMTPHEREVLETLGVQVTNITSNNKDEKGQTSTSEVGELIRVGMGGGQNFYDLNVERKNDASAIERHDIANDPNVATTVRFAQYLDSIGQHGQYTDPKLYQQFLDDSQGKGNVTSNGEASADLTTKMTDQRGLPGPEANSGDPDQASSVIEKGIKYLGGTRIADAIKGVGSMVNGGIDAAGDSAQGWIGSMFSGAGNFVGGLANQGLDALGSGVNAIGGFLGNGLDKAGDVAQNVIGGAGNLVNSLGGAANRGLDFLGNGVTSIGSTVSNGLDKAGDSAKSWLGGIPLVGGFLGNAADKGLDLLGSGASAVSNFVGGGLDIAGDVVQGAGGLFSGAMDFLGGAANKGLDLLGSGASAIGGFLGNGLDKAGDIAQSGISGAADATGGWLGGLVNSGIDWVGRGVGGVINNVGDWAGGKAGDLVHLLQGMGIDAGQIAGLENWDSTNVSEQRGWKNELSDPSETDPKKLQKIDVPNKTGKKPRIEELVTGQMLYDPSAEHAMSAYMD